MRVQIELDEEAVDFLDDLQKVTGIKTRAETIRTALTILRWVVDKRSEGYTILAMKEGSNVAKELSMPALDRVRVEAPSIPRDNHIAAAHK